MSGLPESTWRLVKEQPGVSYEYKEVPLARPQGDELMVRVSKVALCGTDIQLYQWNKGSYGYRGDIPLAADRQQDWVIISAYMRARSYNNNNNET